MITPSRKKIDSNDEIDKFLETLIQQLTIEPITETCGEMRTKIPVSYKEIPSMEKPKAIFIIGPPGSGKTYLLSELFPPNFKYALYNVDIYQEHLLKVNGLFGNKERETAIYNEFKAENSKATEEELQKLTKSRIASIISTSLAISQKCMRQDFDEMISKKLPIIIDRPGDRMSTISDDKKALEKAGYQTMMIFVYVSPITALQRNQQRNRNVHSARLLDSWIRCMKNIATYKKVFGDKFFIIQNDSTPFEINPKDFQSYIPDTLELQKNIKSIKSLMKKPSIFASLKSIRTYIDKFTSK